MWVLDFQGEYPNTLLIQKVELAWLDMATFLIPQNLSHS